jgi:hypothetical protein
MTGIGSGTHKLYSYNTIPMDKWFKGKIETTIKEENKMNYSTAVFLINDKIRAVKVSYEDKTTTPRADEYTYKTLDQSLKKDDLVVVPTKTRHKMTVCRVTEVDVEVDYDSSVEMKWIVDKVDNAAYEALLAQEAQAIKEMRDADAKSKKEALQEKLFKHNLDKIKALPMASMGEETV